MMITQQRNLRNTGFASRDRRSRGAGEPAPWQKIRGNYYRYRETAGDRTFVGPALKGVIMPWKGYYLSIIRCIPASFVIMLAVGGAMATPAAQPVRGDPPLPAPPVLNPAYPSHYTVKPGDTLWDIAARFLRDPWRWEALWRNNPQIQTPRLIFPGDTLILEQEAGAPPESASKPASARLRLERREIKLGPEVRTKPLEKPVAFIPITAIRPFLESPLVLDENDLQNRPYVLAARGEHILGAVGDDIYVRGIDDDQPTLYTVVRAGKPLIDPDSNTTLGYEAINVGLARLVAGGDPAKLTLVRMRREAAIGDRLLPAPADEGMEHFWPRPAPAGLSAHILSVVDGVNQIGRFNVVILAKGAGDDLRRGDVLIIHQSGGTVRDTVAGGIDSDVTLPLERVGELMVFQTFEHTSLALVMKAYTALHIGDIAESPEP